MRLWARDPEAKSNEWHKQLQVACDVVTLRRRRTGFSIVNPTGPIKRGASNPTKEPGHRLMERHGTTKFSGEVAHTTGLMGFDGLTIENPDIIDESGVYRDS
jgi:hypothetical protein